ncbi:MULTISPECIES: hypothetical protein [unclassified Modestobacter]
MGAVIAIVVVLALIGVIAAWGWAVSRGPAGPPALPEGDRALRAQAIATARWTTAHDEVDGVTRVLLRRAFVGPDGRPEVLEERVFESFPSRDPLWEARFTEAMAGARLRCQWLNTEDGLG